MGKIIRNFAFIVTLVCFSVAFSASQFETLKSSYVEAVPGEYLVKVRPHINAGKDLQLLSTQLGYKIFVSLPAQNIFRIQASMMENTESVIQRISSYGFVEVVEPNYIYRVNRTPNDPALPNLWNLINVGQPDSKQQVGRVGIDIGAEKAWDIQTGSRNVVVAVIDTGVDYQAPELKDNMWINEKEFSGQPGVDDDGNGYVDDIYGYNFIDNTADPKDDHGHGTHCSAVIGAKGNDGLGLLGVNWDVRIMAIKFLSADGSGSLEAAIKAIDYATNMGANITSNSWGGMGESELLKQAIQRANEKNVLFVGAAGNNTSDNDKSPYYPSGCPLPNVMAVAAIDNRGALASFSNYGKRSVHVAAPGVNIISLTINGYQSWSGTSMATPHAAGVAALLLANEPQLKPQDVIERLKKTARPLYFLRDKISSGGTVNAYYALTDQVPPLDEDDPASWTDIAPFTYSTPHPYPEDWTDTVELKIPGAKKIALHFSRFKVEAAYDHLTITDKATHRVLAELCGNRDGEYSPIFQSDDLLITFTSDNEVSYYGVDIDKVVYQK